MIAAGSPSARMHSADGVLASVTPAVPERSIVNSVTYVDADALAVALPELTRVYEDAGVSAWTVWVWAEDVHARALLEGAGHRLDAAPAAMGLDLAGWEGPPLDGLAVRAGDVGELAVLNDAAYGFEAPTFARALVAIEDPRAHIYAADVDGLPAATLMTWENEGDAFIGFVATHPRARRRGLAGRLLAHGLREAAARGCTSSTLKA